MPTLLVFAGPNGSGKSTVTAKIQKFGDYVNADMLKAELRCSDMEAAQLAEATREYLLKNRKDFTFETVLSTERNVSLMQRAKICGYTVICIFVLTCDPAINIRRVEERVRRGGHDVPNVKIIKRYKGALKLIPQWLPACDEVYFFDNSMERSQGEPDMIASIINGSLEISPSEVWTEKMIEELLAGKYGQSE